MIPKPKTQSEVILENSNGNSGDALMIALGAAMGFSGGLFGSNNPAYNNPTEIHQRAMQDIRDRDYGNMEDYIDSLYRLVDWYDDLARNYREHLEMYSVEFYDTGEVMSFDPESDAYDTGRETVAEEIEAERLDTSEGFEFDAYINGLMRAEEIARNGR